MATQLHLGDCLEVAKKLADSSINLVYLDPPFFTQKTHKLSTRERDKEFKFDDLWKSVNEYADFLYQRLRGFHRLLTHDGAIYFHCDHTASHIARLMLDEVFGSHMFRAEIIWHYRRWSNSQRNLLPAHQTIYFYSKSEDYKFHEILQDYSPSTNVDQILQKRTRDEYNKSVYAKDDNGSPVINGIKKGVPLSDVWDIPFLNPKAKERTGYPTQKPILLLERIIQISTDENDWILDPFCGSGTTIAASELLRRNSIGIDTSSEAIQVTQGRLNTLVKTESRLLNVGRESYQTVDSEALAYLKGIDLVPVQRNKGIDALLKGEINGGPVPIRVQRSGESLIGAADALYKASITKGASVMILISTEIGLNFDVSHSMPPGVFVIESTSTALRKLMAEFEQNNNQMKVQNRG